MLVPLGLAGGRWPRLSPALRRLAGYLLVAEAAGLTAGVTALYRPRWQLAIGQGFTLIETLFFCRIYYLTPRLPLWPRLIVWLAPLFTLFALFATFYLEDIQQVNACTHVGQSGLLIALAPLCFEQLLRELQIIRLEHDPLFLVSAAVVLYFSGTILLYGFINYFLTAHDYAGNRVICTIHSIVSLIQYSFFALAFWYAGRLPQAPSPS
ncbi:hypothetical protein GCM10022408_34750 [Hymenobacter fastidiosus]|uniref:CPBP family intramembrane metalloprotease n=1 Tax=Hymenobacter fastidiosus TaxID=486264 RepID=A0ABP7SY39_9BACT